eukprot:Polyplicarium_translucidae@DN2548_c0_g1_i3.p3
MDPQDRRCFSRNLARHLGRSTQAPASDVDVRDRLGRRVQISILADFMRLGDLPCQPTDLLKAEFRHFGVPFPVKRCAQCRKYYDPDRSKSRFERHADATAFACQFHPIKRPDYCLCCLQASPMAHRRGVGSGEGERAQMNAILQGIQEPG